MSSGSSPISSMKRVPPPAASKTPARSATAPVNEPLTCPKSSLSMSVGATAAQSSTTKGRAARGLASWMAVARTLLPVPVSPSSSTVLSDLAIDGQRGEDAPHRGAGPEDRAEAILGAQRLADVLVDLVDAQRGAAGAHARAVADVAPVDAHGAHPGAVRRAEIAQQEALRRRGDAEVVARHGGVGQHEVVARHDADGELARAGADDGAGVGALDHRQREAVEAQLVRPRVGENDGALGAHGKPAREEVLDRAWLRWRLRPSVMEARASIVFAETRPRTGG